MNKEFLYYQIKEIKQNVMEILMKIKEHLFPNYLYMSEKFRIFAV